MLGSSACRSVGSRLKIDLPMTSSAAYPKRSCAPDSKWRWYRQGQGLKWRHPMTRSARPSAGANNCNRRLQISKRLTTDELQRVGDILPDTAGHKVREKRHERCPK